MHSTAAPLATPTARSSRPWGRLALLVLTGLAVGYAATHLSAIGASWAHAWRLIAGLGWRWPLVLGVVWLAGLWVHTIVLVASLPGLTHRRALTLNLAGSAVSNVLPLGGIAGTSLNLGMIRGWGHSRLEFARFVVVSKAVDVVAKLLMPLVAVAVLALWHPALPGPGRWLGVAGACAAVGVLVAAALLGQAGPLLRVVAAAERLRDALRRRARGPRTTWTDAATELLDGTDRLVRRRWAQLSWGMAAYWGFQAALLWCCCAAVGLHLPPPVVLAALVTERALTLLAVTPGGAGVVEAGTIGVLIGLGTDPTDALAAVLLYRAFVFAAEIPVGGLATGVWLISRRTCRP